MAASAARHLFFLAASVVAVLAVAAPRSADAWGGGGRFFFSKTTRPEATVEPEKAAALPVRNAAAADTDAAPAFSSRPSTGGSGGRGYGLYGRPEENYPPDYFRRGVHRNAEKLTTATTTTDVPATAGTVEEAAPVRGRGSAGGERVGTTTFPEDGSGRGRPPTDVPRATTTTTRTEEEGGGAAGGDLDGVQPYPENGSGRGRPPYYYTGFHRSSSRQQAEQRDYGMSDTRLYQNGRYYYDVDAGRYGYGRESNPMRTRPAEEEELVSGSGSGSGSGYGRPRGAGGRRYGDAAGYQQRYGNGAEFGNGAMDQNTNGFQEEEAGQNGVYIP